MAAAMRTLTLPGVPESVRRFRALAREASATEYQAEAAALCVSELVTNAIVHTLSGPLHPVTVDIGPAGCLGELHISVLDAGPRRSGPGPSNGYGLGIVDAVAAEWGVLPRPGGGSCFWVEIPEAPVSPDRVSGKPAPAPERVSIAGRLTALADWLEQCLHDEDYDRQAVVESGITQLREIAVLAGNTTGSVLSEVG